MKKLSKWGQTNPRKSRLIITLGHIFTGINACFLGVLTYWVDWEISYWVPFGLANCFFALYLLYPYKNVAHSWFKHSYRRQKSFDFLLMVTYAFVVAGGVNYAIYNIDISDPYFSTVKSESISSSIVHTTASSIENPISKEAQKLKRKELKESRKIQKKALKSQLKELKKELKKQKKEDGGVVLAKIGLIILALAVTIGLGYVVAALACTAACSGAGAWGWVILIAGWGGLIWLLVFTIIKILQKIGRSKNPENKGS